MKTYNKQRFIRASIFSLLALLCIFLSCNNKKSKNNSTEIFSISVQKINTKDLKHFTPSKESNTLPETYELGKPVIYKERTNEITMGEPDVYQVGLLKSHTPGKEGYLKPVSIRPNFHNKKALNPNISESYPAYMTLNNPQSISNYGILQGISNTTIQCLYQDRKGNIWIGSFGGLNKFDGSKFMIYNESHGLLHINVFSITEDRYENLWLGTNKGVVKFDGKTFYECTPKDGLPSERVNVCMEDKSGNIWIGTHKNGIAVYNGQYFTCYNKESGLTDNVIRTIFQDSKGTIWIGTNEGLNIYDGATFKHITKENGLPNNTVLSINEDNNNNIWIGTDGGGLCKYDGKSISVYAEKQGLKNQNILCITKDHQNKLWIGTWGGGVYIYDGKKLKNFTDKDGLPNNKIWCIMEDLNRKIWMGTWGNGLCKYNGDVFTNITDIDILRNSKAKAIKEDKNGNILIGVSGVGFIKYNGIDFEYFNKEQNLSNNDIRSILVDRKGRTWIGTWGGGINIIDGNKLTIYTTKEGLPDNIITKITEDRKGNIWIGTWDGGICRFDGSTFVHYTERDGLSNNRIWDIFEDKEGIFWIGTSEGLNKFDGKQFIRYRLNKKGWDRNYVIQEDKNGNKWVGTGGNGINILCKSKKQKDEYEIYNLNSSNGLISDNIFDLLFTKKGSLIIGSEKGVSIIDSKYFDNIVEQIQLTINQDFPLFKNYTYDEGMIGIGINDGETLHEDKNGNIWMGTFDRITIFHPTTDVYISKPPRVELSSIKLFNERIDWVSLTKKSINNQSTEIFESKDTSITLQNGVILDKIKFDNITSWSGTPENLILSYRENNITFEYSGMSMDGNVKLKYKHKLDGIDENWSKPSFDTHTSYGNLPYGKYTFNVKAMNSEGVWSNNLSYDFTIRPPWWSTVWFRILLISLIIIILFLILEWRISTLNKQKELLKEEVEKKTVELHNQNEHLIATLSELQSTQNQLIHSEKMASLGVLSAGIAHEINNPLNFIKGGYLGINSYIKKNIDNKDEKVNVFLNAIDTGVERAKSIVKSLGAYSRKEDSEKTSCNIHNIIENCLVLLESSFKYKIEVIRDYCSDDSNIIANEGMIHQVFINILSNAEQAIDNQGKILIKTYRDEKYFGVSISDNGSGMSKEVLNRIFDPFFTTKDPGKGTGLGMSITQKIVHEHQGTIEYESIPEKGTTVHIKFAV